MSFFSKFFKSPVPEYEIELFNTNVEMLCMMGHPRREAESVVRDAIKQFKAEMAADGTDRLRDNIGTQIVEEARNGHEGSIAIIKTALEEGATYKDIEEWWNLPELARRMVQWSENSFRIAVFMQADEEGLSSEEAAARVHMMFPSYGDPESSISQKGDDRKLPPELRGRVDAFRQSHGAKYISEQVKNYSSYNAFVRHAIKEGLL